MQRRRPSFRERHPHRFRNDGRGLEVVVFIILGLMFVVLVLGKAMPGAFGMG